MRLSGEIPVEVTDKGAWQLDENQILAQSQEVAGFKLTWLYACRGRPWRKAPLLAVFRTGEWNWPLARVALSACESCGIEAGTQWVIEKDTSDRSWVCDGCRDEIGG